MNLFEILIAGSVLGLAGSLHCVGMCGPIILALPFNETTWLSRFTSNAVYFLGKALTYAVLGLFIGLMGTAIFPKQWQQAISIGSGVFILAMTWLPKMVNSSSTSKFQKKVISGIAIWMRKKGYAAQFIVGLLNGFLPCGMVYMALAASLTAGGALKSSFFMFVFGLGTAPLLFIIGISKKAMSLKFRKAFNTSLPYVTTVLAILFILRGLSLGIPMLSPDLSKAPQSHMEMHEHSHH